MNNKIFVVMISLILMFSGCLGDETVDQNTDSDNIVEVSDNATLFEGDEAGECSDLADNDQDGLFDCDDPNCSGSPICQSSDNPCVDTGDNTSNNTGNNTGNSTGNNTGDNTGNSTGNNTGDNTGNSTGNNTGNNTTSNYSGNWTLQSPISYTCAWGSINLNISNIEIAEFDSNQPNENFSLNVSEYNGGILTMEGTYSNDSFEVSHYISSGGSGCDERYTFSGQFINLTISGIFEAEYIGTQCYDCAGGTWNINANLT